MCRTCGFTHEETICPRWSMPAVFGYADDAGDQIEVWPTHDDVPGELVSFAVNDNGPVHMPKTEVARLIGQLAELIAAPTDDGHRRRMPRPSHRPGQVVRPGSGATRNHGRRREVNTFTTIQKIINEAEMTGLPVPGYVTVSIHDDGIPLVVFQFTTPHQVEQWANHNNADLVRSHRDGHVTYSHELLGDEFTVHLYCLVYDKEKT